MTDTPKRSPYAAGFEEIAKDIHMGHGEIVVTGTPCSHEEDGPTVHDCDAMGCGWWHVLYRAPMFALPPVRSLREDANPFIYKVITAQGGWYAVAYDAATAEGIRRECDEIFPLRAPHRLVPHYEHIVIVQPDKEAKPGLPPGESPQRNAVCDALTEALRFVGETASESGERTTIDLEDEGHLRGLARLLTTRDRDGRDGALGENTQRLWERIGEALGSVSVEMPAIDWGVVLAGENTCTAPHNLRLGVGNPDHQHDSLHQFGYDDEGKPNHNMRCIRISALDHPNVVCDDADIVPGAVSTKSVRKRLEKYKQDGRLYKSRVRGLSPSEAVDALIKLEWVVRAQKRWENEQDKLVLTQNGRAPKALGVDVANSEEGDEASITRWTGAYCREVVSFACPDANILGYDVHVEMQRDAILDEHVGVDKVGVGVGTVNELKRLKKYIVGLGGGDKAQGRVDEHGEAEEEKYDNLRSQMYWVLAKDLEHDRIALPPSRRLAQELIRLRWSTKDGKILVESKEKIKERTPGGKSPNESDATAYGNWVRPRITFASTLPKRPPTQAQRILKELEEMDKRDHDYYEEPVKGTKYGTILRQ